MPLDLGEPIGEASKQNALRMLAKELDKKSMKNNVMATSIGKIPNFRGLDKLSHNTNLWYAEIELRSPVSGPLVLGQRTELGFGLLAPAPLPNVAYYAVVGRRPPIQKTIRVADAVRTAVMSQAGKIRRDRYIPRSLSGHDERGRSLQDDHNHASWLPVDNDGDGLIDHVAVYARSGFEPSIWRAFSAVTDVYTERSHMIRIRFVGLHRSEELARQCPLFRKGEKWVSLTPYYPPWHLKSKFGVTEQIKKELKKRHMRYAKYVTSEDKVQSPTIRNVVPPHLFEASRAGRAPPHRIGRRVTVVFNKSIHGPVLLGHNSHFGLGVFVPVAEKSSA